MDAIITGKRDAMTENGESCEKKNTYYNTIITNPSRVNKDWARERRRRRRRHRVYIGHHYPIHNVIYICIIYYILCLHVPTCGVVLTYYYIIYMSNFDWAHPFYFVYDFFPSYRSHEARGRYILLLLFVISWCFYFILFFYFDDNPRSVFQLENW